MISRLTGFLTKPSQGMATLNLQISKFPTQFRTIVTHILIAARLTITKRWKTTCAPEIAEVVHRVNMHCLYERAIACNNNSLGSFNHKWDIWIQVYLQDERF